MPDTLIVGVGGAGIHACRRLAERLAESAVPGSAAPPSVQFLLLDTDRAEAAGTGDVVTLTTTAAVLDAAYRAPERFHAEWLAPEVLRSGGSLERGAAGSRMLGRFLLLLPENVGPVRERLRAWLSAASGPEPARVWIVSSAAGGTGSGQLVDLGYLVQDVAASLERAVDARAVLFVPPPAETTFAANAYATLAELHYFSDPRTLYHAHFGGVEFQTRRAPFHRVGLLTSLTVEGETVPLAELQERASVYLYTACAGDRGSWDAERAEREAAVSRLDLDENPQAFATFGAEWVEYPEERLVRAVYRNLLRRSLGYWLHGDRPAHATELPTNVPLHDGELMARLLMDAVPLGDGTGTSGELFRPVAARLPWIHKAPPSQWAVMDQELEALVAGAAGSPPALGKPGRGPLADRARSMRDQHAAELATQAGEWLSRENQSLDRVARALNEAALELEAISDPVVKWEAALEAARTAKANLLWTVAAARRDPFLFLGRAAALRKLAGEYERLAGRYAVFSLQARTIPFIHEVRGHIAQPLRAWAKRTGEIRGILADLAAAWADEESALLERLRRNQEEGRLALGKIRLPGKETPYVANSGWSLPYAGPADETAAIEALRDGWIERLVRAGDGLLAGPGRSALDGGPDGPRRVAADVDRSLRERIEERLRGWLSATAFQRLAEGYGEAVELEFHLRRLVHGAADLPALDPPHTRPGGFPSEYELVFFGEQKETEFPPVLRMVVDVANRDRPTRLVTARSANYLTAISEHAGFSLARCPAFLNLEERYGELALPAHAGPFSRADVPWTSATLLTRGRYRDASNVLLLALALGILRPNPAGEYPIPASILGEAGRFPLPGEFDRAARQVAGDLRLLEALSLGVDRSVQAKGVEWCALQLDRAVRGLAPLRVGFPGADDWERSRALHLAALRAAGRYEDLIQEYSRTEAARDAEWLRAEAGYACPACAHPLGGDPESLPGACPACREPLLPQKLHTLSADDFRRIPNPYGVGTPLETGASVFVGREDIIQQVRERLIRPAQRTILILIGERRCGKTSALRQLQYRLEGDLTPIFVDMQGLTATDLPGFLWWLAWRMKEALDERGISVDLPSYAEFTSGPPDYQFETRIMPEIQKKLSGGRILLMLDEFEVLAQRVMNGTFDSRAFDYLRHLMQHGAGIEFLFAGTHILRQFAANYVTFLFNIGLFLDVAFLAPEDALRLIREPVASAGVTYTPEAESALMELAGSHAYFTQLFCFQLVERCNRLRKREVDGEDVEAESGPVIAAAGAHLDHVWGQLTDADRLLISFFVEFCPRGERRPERELLEAATREDPSLRPYLFRTSVEKLITVGLLRPTEVPGAASDARTLSLTAEVYRQWLTSAHSYQRLREEGLAWG